MRRILLIVGVLAFTVSAGAQTVNPNRLGLQRFSARSVEEPAAGVFHLTGDVRVWVGTALVTADAAVINTTSYEVEFRGNVRMAAASGR